MPGPTRTVIALNGVPNSQNANVNGLLRELVWSGSALTYSFPTDPSQYTGYAAGDEIGQNFGVAGQPYRAAAKFALDTLSEFTNLTFTEIAPSAVSPATLRFGISSGIPVNGRAPTDTAGWAYFPADVAYAGDVWINSNQNINVPFQPGAFKWSTTIHEVGHAVGLGHPFTTTNLGGTTMIDPSKDSTEYTVMSYRASASVPSRGTVGFAEAGGEPQTWMQYDVAALQYAYGANYNTRAGNTVYTWNPTTGQMSIDGVAYSSAPGINRILMNIWDGDGIDTYDFSNYTTNVISDLRPGEWSTPSQEQLPITNTQGDPSPVRAVGSISNSLLFNGDLRSLIENAIGGSANDVLRGNQANNSLIGNAGQDTLFGDDGNDSLYGGLGADTLDGGAGFDFARYDYAASAVVAVLFLPSVNAGEAAGDSYVSIEGLVGSAFDDNLQGDTNANTILGLAGIDLLFGREGNDTLDAGDGNDHLWGGTGTDYIDGGAGYDYARYDYAATGVTARLDLPNLNTGEAAGDYYVNIEGLVGSSFNDTLVGTNAGNDTLIGLDGDNLLLGLAGNDGLVGGSGNDSLWGGEGADVLIGGGGFDYARYDYAAAGVTARLDLPNLNTGEAAGDVYTSIEGLVGSNFADALVGDGGNNYIFGQGGNDALYGLGGADNLFGGAGNDTFAFFASDFQANVYDSINDLNNASGDYDLIALVGVNGADLRYFDTPSGALITNATLNGNGGIIIANHTLSQIGAQIYTA